MGALECIVVIAGVALYGVVAWIMWKQKMRDKPPKKKDDWWAGFGL